MRWNRRDFLHIAAGSVVVSALPSSPVSQAVASPRFKAIAFDAFPVLDPRPVFALAESLFPGKGSDLGNAWRSRQFEYQWLRALAGHYADFWETTEAGLVFAAGSLHLDLSPASRSQLMDAYLGLKAWPEAPSALRALKAAGIRLAFLSNMTSMLLDAGIKNSGLEGLFEHVLSTDRVKSFKPDPRAYQMGLDAFKLQREEILFVAFAGWDAAGAKWFGYPTFWVNRLGVPAEELGVVADGVGRDLTELVGFVTGER